MSENYLLTSVHSILDNTSVHSILDNIRFDIWPETAEILVLFRNVISQDELVRNTD